MRVVPLILALLFLLAGIAFGALNPGDVTLDFHRCQLVLPLGVALIAFGLAGALTAGLLLWLTVIWPQRRRIAALSRSGVQALPVVAPTDLSGTGSAEP
ncbi:LapA family protein [Xanthomonadaceae bacterium JHOS43]|nr:LapA family protein [Xanthomonadaceae bacterium JHOS43]